MIDEQMIDVGFSTVAVVGLGYIGLPMAALLASTNVNVIGVDINESIVETVNSGDIHFVEPGLAEMVSKAVSSGRFRAVREPIEADAFIIAVPTPFDSGTKVPDISFVEAAIKAVAGVLKTGDLIIIESTCPVGTTDRLAAVLAGMRVDLRIAGVHSGKPDVHLAYCPERVLPGNMLHELVNNDRVIGGLTVGCSARASRLYQIFVRGECVVATNAKTAELAKLTENSFRDVNIAFANEIERIGNDFGVDVWELIELVNRHPRVNMLLPGAGVGGHCIAVDPWFIVHATGGQAPLIQAAREVNDAKPDIVVARVVREIERGLFDSVVVLGLSYKPDVDDARESPCLKIAEKLSATLDCCVSACDPYFKTRPTTLPAEVGFLSWDRLEAPSGAFAVVLVGHSQFVHAPQSYWSQFKGGLSFCAFQPIWRG